MGSWGVAFACLVLASAAGPVLSTKVGDEGYASLVPNITGTFYAFADKTIHVINPALRTIIKNITSDERGMPLTNEGSIGGSINASRAWNDPVYMEDPARNIRYIFINEGDVYPKEDGTQVSFVTVIDTATDKIVARVEVGPNPVHIYGVRSTKEVWTHPDKGGDFYVISLANISSLNATRVPGLVRKAGHGKLLVDDTLAPKAYGTNVNEQYLFEYDLIGRKRVASHDFSTLIPSNASCFGTHAIAYSNFSQHVYAECVGQGVLEWNSVNNTLVKFWPEGGSVVAAPGNDYILIVNKANNLVTVLRPSVNGAPSQMVLEVPVPGNPAVPKFFSLKATEDAALHNYLVYFPLTRITNMNNIRAATLLDVDVTSRAYLKQPVDCKYAAADAPGAVTAASIPPAGLSLARTLGGNPVTPNCGACAIGYNPLDPTQFNASLSGFRVMNLLEAAKKKASPLVPAGAVFVRKDTGAYGPSAECSFANTYRQAKRGGRFVATVADLPYPSVYFVEASTTPLLANPVRTASSPKQITWAPIVPSP